MFYIFKCGFFHHDPIPIWLAIQLFVGSVVTLAAINISFAGRYFYVIHVVLFANVIWNGINLLMIQGTSQWQVILFSIYVLLLVGLGIIAIIRNSYYSSGSAKSNQHQRGVVLLSYVLNLLFGAAVVCVSLFALWGILAFGELRIKAILTVVPIITWLISYKFQMRYIAKNHFFQL